MAIDLSANETDRLLKEGQAAARSGNMARARELLTQVVERDPHNEKAWLWLSGTVADPEEQQICLENVLVINPHNMKARKGLEFISARTGLAPNIPNLPPEVGQAPKQTASLAQGSSPFSGQAAPGAAMGGMANGQPAPQMPFGASAVNTPTMSGPLTPPPWEQSNAAAASAPSSQWPGADVSPFGATPPFGHASAMAEPMAQEPVFGAPATTPYENFQGDFRGDFLPDLEPFVPEAAATLMQANPAHDVASPYEMPTDPALPAWSMDPRVPGFDGSAILNLSDQDLPQGVPVAPTFEPASSPEPVTEPAYEDKGNMPAVGFSPMGPLSDQDLPKPSDLPGFMGATENDSQASESAEQPWYLQSVGDAGPSNQADATPAYAIEHEMDRGGERDKGDKPVTIPTIGCPNCHENVPETSLACSRCRFNFFVNCPNCHELVDVTDTKPGQTEACPYCKHEISKMELGLHGSITYQASEARGHGSSLMQGFQAPEIAVRRLSFAWVVDLLWLVVIVATIWALTQLPTWLNLTGQY